jgi:hypothetical protein
MTTQLLLRHQVTHVNGFVAIGSISCGWDGATPVKTESIQMARDSGVWVDFWDDMDGMTLGAHVLEAIEREVDYAKLAPWRREGLEKLRAQLDAGELAGESLHPSDRSDRAGYALRMAELEAIIQDYKHSGDTSLRPVQLSWEQLGEEEKLDRIERAIGFLSLEGESKTGHFIGREVDLARVPEDRRPAAQGRQEEASDDGEEVLLSAMAEDEPEAAVPLLEAGHGSLQCHPNRVANLLPIAGLWRRPLVVSYCRRQDLNLHPLVSGPAPQAGASANSATPAE